MESVLMNVGEHVRHRHHGDGVVTSIRGGFLEVQFEDQSRYVRNDSLVSLEAHIKMRAREQQQLEKKTRALRFLERIDAYDGPSERARAVREWMQGYPKSSLSRLDEQHPHRFPELSAEDYARLKLPKLRVRLARLGLPLNDEQLLACARPERHRLIRARAGSGKTRTLAAQAALAIHDESLDPNQVLVLAFNKKAAAEIGERIRNAAGIAEFKNARTFHSLAWQLADHAGRDLIFDDGNLSPSRRKLTGFVERLIESIMNPAFREQLYEFFRHELEQLDCLGSTLSKEDYTSFRRSLADYTLGGETVKSNGEKFIADFLFEHGVSYKYEQVWSWDVTNRLRGLPYRPDFCIINDGRDFVLEHWAINPDDPAAEVPTWWETTTSEYREQIKAKREFWATRGISLLETHSEMLTEGREAFEQRLTSIFKESGFRIKRLPHEELVRRVTEAPRTVSRMAALFVQFISRAKKRGWKPKDVVSILQSSPDPEPRNRVFHEMAAHAYAMYERRLTEISAIDFDDLLISAAECVKLDGPTARLLLDRNDSIAIGDLRWILIDEFQDFSELYYRLISEILNVNPNIRIVSVGDDWQAINGFAGAQLTFFSRFSQCFAGAGTAAISTNRRSGRAIIGAANKLMVGCGVPALAHHKWHGRISTVMIDKIRLEGESSYVQVATRTRDDGGRTVNWELAKALKACSDFIAESAFSLPKDNTRWLPTVLILARTDRAYGTTLADFGRRLETVLVSHPDLQDLASRICVGNPPQWDAAVRSIEVMTVHKAKGKEADTVIVLEAVSRQFPKLHADNQLFGPFGVTAADVLAEERRLFYVALTRAEHRLMLLSESGKESPYQDAMRGDQLAEVRVDHSVGSSLGDAEIDVLSAYLDRIDRSVLVSHNISCAAKRAWEHSAELLAKLPEVGFSLGDDLHAELAWPDLKPPVAVLTGQHRAYAASWTEAGWRVL
jgi:DNA helicase-4